MAVHLVANLGRLRPENSRHQLALEIPNLDPPMPVPKSFGKELLLARNFRLDLIRGPFLSAPLETSINLSTRVSRIGTTISFSVGRRPFASVKMQMASSRLLAATAEVAQEFLREHRKFETFHHVPTDPAGLRPSRRAAAPDMRGRRGKTSVN